LCGNEIPTRALECPTVSQLCLALILCGSYEAQAAPLTVHRFKDQLCLPLARVCIQRAKVYLSLSLVCPSSAQVCPTLSQVCSRLALPSVFKTNTRVWQTGGAGSTAERAALQRPAGRRPASLRQAGLARAHLPPGAIPRGEWLVAPV